MDNPPTAPSPDSAVTADFSHGRLPDRQRGCLPAAAAPQHLLHLHLSAASAVHVLLLAMRGPGPSSRGSLCIVHKQMARPA